MRAWIAAALLAAFQLTTAPGVAAAVPGPEWPHEQSDLVLDPSVSVGKLDNGFRYAVIHNEKPAGRVSVFMDVQTGSLMERDDQLGLAHYLEHMAFNGSKHFPEGSLVTFFQTHGMGFGADANAHTSLHETVYKFHLAHNDEAAVKDGFKVLRDMADGLTIADGAVDRERGVILSEKSARESKGTKDNDAWRRFVFNGTRLVNSPIGTEAVIRSANGAKIREYYEKWYVPERMVLVVVGDVTAKAVKPWIEEAFGSMKARPNPTFAGVGKVNREGVKVLVQPNDEPAVGVTVQIMQPAADGTDTRQTRLDEDCRRIASAILSLRLRERAQKEPTRWMGANYQNLENIPFGGYTVFKAVTTPDQWKAALAGLYEEMTLIKRDGATAAEVQGHLGSLQKAYEQRVKLAASRSNAERAKAFVRTLNAGRVTTSPEANLKRFMAQKGEITRERINASIRKTLAANNRRIRLTGPLTVSADEVKVYWDSLQSAKVKPRDRTVRALYPYIKAPAVPAALPLMEGSTITATDEALKQYRFTLKNGTRVVLLPLPYEKGEVAASYYFGGGLAAVPTEELDTARLAQTVMGQAGPGRLTQTVASRLFSSRGLVVRESVEHENNVIVGSARREDAREMIALMWTQLVDPTVKQENLDKVLQRFAMGEKRRLTSVKGAAVEQGRFFTGENTRNALMTSQKAKAVTLEAMQDYLNRAHERGERLLVVGGDFDLEDMRRAVTQYFGYVPQSKEEIRNHTIDYVFPAGKVINKVVKEDTVGKAYYYAAWHADIAQATDRRTRLVRRLAASVFSQRLRQAVREDRGLVYSPSVAYHVKSRRNGFGYLKVSMQTKTENLPLLQSSVDEVAASFKDRPVSPEEFSAVAEPMKTAWRSQQKKNLLWYRLVSAQARTGLPYVAWYDNNARLLASISVRDVQAAIVAMLDAPKAVFTVQGGDKPAAP